MVEGEPLLPKDRQIHSIRWGRSNRYRVIIISVTTLLALATVSLWQKADHPGRQMVSLDEDSDDDVEFYGNDMSMYAIQCCSPQDISCCHTATSSAWVPGAAIVDISKTCKWQQAHSR